MPLATPQHRTSLELAPAPISPSSQHIGRGRGDARGPNIRPPPGNRLSGAAFTRSAATTSDAGPKAKMQLQAARSMPSTVGGQTKVGAGDALQPSLGPSTKVDSDWNNGDDADDLRRPNLRTSRSQDAVQLDGYGGPEWISQEPGTHGKIYHGLSNVSAFTPSRRERGPQIPTASATVSVSAWGQLPLDPSSPTVGTPLPADAADLNEVQLISTDRTPPSALHSPESSSLPQGTDRLLKNRGLCFTRAHVYGSGVLQVVAAILLLMIAVFAILADDTAVLWTTPALLTAGAFALGIGIGLCWASYHRSLVWLRRFEYTLLVLFAAVYMFFCESFILVSNVTSAKEYIELHWVDVASELGSATCDEAAIQGRCPAASGTGGSFYSTDPAFLSCMVREAPAAAEDGAHGRGAEESESWSSSAVPPPAASLTARWDGSSTAAAVCCRQLRCQQWLLGEIASWYLGATILCLWLAALLGVWSTLVLWLLERRLEPLASGPSRTSSMIILLLIAASSLLAIGLGFHVWLNLATPLSVGAGISAAGLLSALGAAVGAASMWRLRTTEDVIQEQRSPSCYTCPNSLVKASAYVLRLFALGWLTLGSVTAYVRKTETNVRKLYTDLWIQRYEESPEARLWCVQTHNTTGAATCAVHAFTSARDRVRGLSVGGGFVLLCTCLAICLVNRTKLLFEEDKREEEEAAMKAEHRRWSAKKDREQRRKQQLPKPNLP